VAIAVEAVRARRRNRVISRSTSPRLAGGAGGGGEVRLLVTLAAYPPLL
jgi:hypothetical protein